jgi:hypothetical protein
MNLSKSVMAMSCRGRRLGVHLRVGIGVCGLFLTGLVAAIAVYAMRAALTGRDTD